MGTADQNQLMAAAKKVKGAHVENLGKEINELFKEIVTNEPRVKIPEVVFVETYLPEFRNIKTEKADGSRADNSAVIKTWISLTGSQYKAADIVDRDGKVVITIPPIYTPVIIDHEKQANNKLGGIGEDYGKKAQGNSIMANEFIRTALTSAAEAVKPDLDHNVTEWRKVFEYYDKKIEKNPIKAMDRIVDEAVSKQLDEEGDPKYKFGKPLNKKAYDDDE